MSQVKAYGPGLKPTGVTVNKPTEFTIDARMAGKGQLKIYAQVWRFSLAKTLVSTSKDMCFVLTYVSICSGC